MGETSIDEETNRFANPKELHSAAVESLAGLDQITSRAPFQLVIL